MGPELTSGSDFLPGPWAALSLAGMRARRLVKTAAALLLFIPTAVIPCSARADWGAGRKPAHPAGARGAEHGSNGRPKVILDQLDLAKAPLPSSEEKYLRDVLAHEVRLADWGAGRRSQIQYRFRIDELDVVEEPSVLRIRCSATGWLPKGKTAKSRLAFGGSPKDRTELVRHVLAIVARGVVTRLAELERQRRTTMPLSSPATLLHTPRP